MKEMTIEQKAKAYDKAIEHARSLLKTIGNATLGNLVLKNEFKTMFPALEESEDERIKKTLIKYFRNCVSLEGINGEDISNWLEKQGEHANFRNKIQVGDKVTRNKDGVLVNLSQLKRVAKPAEEYNITGIGSKHATGKLAEKIKELKPLNEILEKQCEQKTVDEIAKEVCKNKASAITFLKSAGIMNEKGELADEYKIEQDEQNYTWSEEDEDYYDAIISKLEVTQDDALLTDNQMKFLKSLKDRYTWKPSNEQMEGIEYTIKTLRYQLNAGDNRLNSLYNDLKKLREK